MKWFYNLKLSSKLLTSFSVTILLTVILGLFSIYKLSDVNSTATEMEYDWMPSIRYASGMNTNAADFRVAELQYVLSQNDQERHSFEKEMKEHLTNLESNEKTYSPLVSNDEEKRAIERFNSVWEEYLDINKKVMELARLNKGADAISLLRGKSQDSFDKAIHELEDIVELNHQGGITASRRGDALYTSSRTTIIAILLLCAMLGGIIAMFVSKVIGKPVKSLTAAADKLASGDINVSVEATTKDEIGMLSQAFVKMINNLKALVDDANTLTIAAGEGKLQVRADASRHQGEYKKVILGINNTLDGVIGPLTIAAKYIDRISIGDLPEKITASYKGDFVLIINNLNSLLDAMNNITDVAEQIAEGNLMVSAKERSDKDKLMHALDKMIKGLTEVVENVKQASDNVATGAQEMSSSSEEMSQGATEQAAAAEEASSSMEEMTSNIRQNADNAQQTERI
ncbi:MAG: MCP four helix bundle domain-containing protein, partial [Ignavibacteriales bacterium]